MDRPDCEFLGDAAAVSDADLCGSCGPPSLDDTRVAVNQLKNGKALGGCGIYAETIKAEEAAELLWLHTLLCFILNTEVIPTD